MDVKQEIDLSNTIETLIPLKELKPFLDDDGKSIAFEEGNNLMILVIYKDNLFKKRVNKKHFKMDINEQILKDAK